MKFLNDIHHCNYMKCIVDAKIEKIDDIERKALFYIIAGNEELFTNRKKIYDFEDGCIAPEVLDDENIFWCSSSKNLIKLAFNLFNGYSDNETNLMQILNPLDSTNLKLAIKSICIRVSKTDLLLR